MYKKKPSHCRISIHTKNPSYTYNVRVTERVSQHGRKHEAEQGGSKHTALFHSVGYRERLRSLSIVLNSGTHPIVKLTDDGNELSWASILCHDSPKALSTNSVKGLGQIDVGGVQVGVLFLAFLLKLSSGKYHVDSPAIFPESTLAFWKETPL